MAKLTKRAKHFASIEESKDRFRHLSTEEIRKRLNFGSLTKTGAIAYREVLAERDETEPTKSRKAKKP